MSAKHINIVELFSGICGFSLAAQMVYGADNVNVVLACDNDKYAQLIARSHYPNAKIIDDVAKVTKDSINGTTIDVLTGGFPCQPFSGAGKQAGTQDDRYLWPQMYRVIRELRPRWVIAENVSGIYTIEKGVVFEQVCSEMEDAGYIVWPLRLCAAGKNAPHKRDRWFFVAYCDSHGLNASNSQDDTFASQRWLNARRDTIAVCDNKNSANATNADSLGSKRSASSGHQRSVLPHQERHHSQDQPEGHRRNSRPCQNIAERASDVTADVANTSSLDSGRVRRQRQHIDSQQPIYSNIENDRDYLLSQTQPAGARTTEDAHNANGNVYQGWYHRPRQEKFDRSNQQSQYQAQYHDRFDRHWLQVATEFCRMDDGLSFAMDLAERTKRLKALGNAVVPQVVAEIFKSIQEIDGFVESVLQRRNATATNTQ